MNNQLQLSVTIKDVQKTVFDGFVKAVSSVSSKGKFDILPYHANFIALIKDSITIHHEGKNPERLPIETGVMEVEKNSVKIVLGVETKPITR